MRGQEKQLEGWRQCGSGTVLWNVLPCEYVFPKFLQCSLCRFTTETHNTLSLLIVRHKLAVAGVRPCGERLWGCRRSNAGVSGASCAKALCRRIPLRECGVSASGVQGGRHTAENGVWRRLATTLRAGPWTSGRTARWAGPVPCKGCRKRLWSAGLPPGVFAPSHGWRPWFLRLRLPCQGFA